MKNLAIETTEVRSNMKLFDFLQERHNERYTRFEAYCYLLNKAYVQYVPENFPTDGFPALEKNQFITTKTELADVWHWHRATVRGFLDKLEECGQLIRKEYSKCILCQMTALSSNSESNDCMFTQFVDTVLVKFTAPQFTDRLSLQTLSELYGHLIRSIISLRMKMCPNEPAQQRCNFEISITSKVILEHLSFYCLWAVDDCQLADINSSLTELFFDHYGKNWLMLLKFMKTIPTEAAQCRLDSEFIANENTAELLNRIYRQVDAFRALQSAASHSASSVISSQD